VIADPRTPLLYFGRQWDYRQFTNAVHINPPVGLHCAQCVEPIRPGDRGVIAASVHIRDGDLAVVRAPVHMECELRSVIGGAGHFFGGPVGPWRGTYRQEAHRIVAEINRIRQQRRMEPL
jgi:hypothetical protein